MNANRLISMILRKLMNRGIRHGIDHMARRGKDPAAMTPEEKRRAAAGKAQAKRARQALRVGRKIGRF